MAITLSVYGFGVYSSPTGGSLTAPQHAVCWFNGVAGCHQYTGAAAVAGIRSSLPFYDEFTGQWLELNSYNQVVSSVKGVVEEMQEHERKS